MEQVSIFFSRRWWWATLLVLAGVVVMLWLSRWQFSRLAERRAANAVLQAQLDQPPLLLHEIDLDDAILAEQVGRTAVVRGQFDLSQQVLLKLQSYRGSPGENLLAPLRIEGSDRAVLVDRGWLPAAESAPEFWSRYDEPGTVTITGTLQATETARQVTPSADPQEEWYRIDVEAIQRQLPYDILPVYLNQAPTPADEAAGSLPAREAIEADLSEGPHLSYALQWIAFSLMLAGGYFYYVRRSVT